MANEVYYSTSGDIRLATQLHQEYLLLLADRGFLWRHDSVMYLGDAAGSGSTALEVPQAGLGGYDSMASIAESGGSPANTGLTDASPSITVARQYLQRQMTDINDAVDSVGINVDALASDGVMSAQKRFTEMLTAITDDFTATAGTSGSDMTVDDWYDAQFTLTVASVPGTYACVLHPRQLADFQESLRAEGGAIQFREATADMLAIKGQGFAGSFNGVDIYPSATVPTANSGADRAGGMWGRGAVGYRELSLRRIRGAGELLMPAGSPIVTEFERDASNALTTLVHNYYVGLAIIEDGRGVSIITDA